MVLEQVLAFMYAEMSYFMQGADLMKDLEPFMRDLSLRVRGMNKNSEKHKSKKERRRYMHI